MCECMCAYIYQQINLYYNFFVSYIYVLITTNSNSPIAEGVICTPYLWQIKHFHSSRLEQQVVPKLECHILKIHFSKVVGEMLPDGKAVFAPCAATKPPQLFCLALSISYFRTVRANEVWQIFLQAKCYIFKQTRLLPLPIREEACSFASANPPTS